MTRRTIEHSIETIPDPGDEAIAAQLLGMWPDGLADFIGTRPEPDHYEPIDPPQWPGDDSVIAVGYFGYAFIFERAGYFTMIGLPPSVMRTLVRDADLFQKYVDRIRHGLTVAIARGPGRPPFAHQEPEPA